MKITRQLLNTSVVVMLTTSWKDDNLIYFTSINLPHHNVEWDMEMLKMFGTQLVNCTKKSDIFSGFKEFRSRSADGHQINCHYLCVPAVSQPQEAWIQICAG